MLPPIPPDDLLPPFRETDWRYARSIAASGDTWLHLPTLRALTRRAVTRTDDEDRVEVVEFGVRGIVTTWAFLAARPSSLVSVDIVAPPDSELDVVRACAAEEGIDFRFDLGDTLEIAPVSCHLLFIDTLHTAAQFRAELARHAAGVTRFIAMHDTISFGFTGEDGSTPGLQDVVEELVAGGIAGTGKWALRWHDERCNGLAIVERVG